MRIIRAGRVFDGERLHDDHEVVVGDDGRILQVRPVIRDDRAGSHESEVVDHGPGATLLPGLVDGHQHLSWGCTTAVLDGLPDSREALIDQARANARRALAAGVTTLQDLGDSAYAVLDLRDEVAGDRRMPRILGSGPPITSPGGHCHFLLGAETRAEKVADAVHRRAERGVDVIKVMSSGGNVTPGSLPWESQFDLATLRVLVDEAHRLGLRVAAHAHGAPALLDCVEAGVDAVEHITLMTPDGVERDDEVLRRLAESGTVLRLTPGSMPGGPPPPPAILDRLPLIFANIARLRALRARIVVSTDAGISPGKPQDSLAYSACHYAQAGVGAVEVLTAVTSLAADAVGLGSVVGRLAPGFAADLVVVRGDPTSDLAQLVEVEAVYREGERVAGPSSRPRPEPIAMAR